MTSKYQKWHYEDVARLLKEQRSSAAPLNWVGHIAETETNATVERMANRFADLFAADNPNRCLMCNASEAAADLPCCRIGNIHEFRGGFDREQFLKACGLREGKELSNA